MPTRIVQTARAVETEALAAELAVLLRPGDVVLVRGELGAGKTTFVRGAARALGVRTRVTSPTFAIGHLYRTHPPHPGTRPATVAHLDLYRLSALGSEEPDMLADYIGPGQIAFVEWPSDDTTELAEPALVVTIEHAGGDTRRIGIDWPARSDQPTACAAAPARATAPADAMTGTAAAR